MLTQIGQIAINVHDVDRAVAFYRDVLGMKFLFQAPPDEPKLGFFDCGGVRLILSLPEKREFDHPASIVYYKVADVAETHDALASRGVTFEHEPSVVHRTETYELWMAFFRDPEGNLLALMSEVPVEA